MSGLGSRFIDAGYKEIKPLVKVFNKPIIKYIVEKFSPEDNFIFVCRQEHLSNKEIKLESYLNSLAKNTTILEVENHKLGPVHSILKVEEIIKDLGELVVNYCDFDWRWDYENFKLWLETEKPDAAICVYSGFQPHYINPATYAYTRSEQHNVLEIREKQSFTKYREEEPAASGTFYFSSAEALLDSCKWLINKNEHINGEFYVSLLFNYFPQKKLRTLNYFISHFMQWGTPRDLEEFIFFARKIPQKFLENKLNCPTITLMAGKGNRMKSIDSVKKPYLKVRDECLFSFCTKNFYSEKLNILAVNGDKEDMKYVNNSPNTKFVLVGETKSSVETLLIATEDKNLSPNEAIFVMPCDASIDVNWTSFNAKISGKHNCEGVVFSYEEYPYARWNPEQYGWLEIGEDQLVCKVGLKTGWNADFSNPMITGYFWFPNIGKLRNNLKLFFKSRGKDKSEPSIDEFIHYLIHCNKKVHSFPANDFLCLGIPLELRAYEYWLDADQKSRLR